MLYECICNSFVAFHAVMHMCVFCASQTGDFLTNFTIIAPISSRFLHSTHVFSMLCFCLLWSLFPQISSCTL